MSQFHRTLHYCSLIIVVIAVFVIGLKVLSITHPATFLKAMRWPDRTTKLNYMQSIFQLGAATSIAFALAGPQIRHVLGPKIRIVKLFVNTTATKHPNQLQESSLLVHSLCTLEDHQQDLGETQRGALYIIHLSAILYNVIILIWSSLIDPNGKIWNAGAFYLLIGCIGFPMIDLIQAYTDSSPIRRLLQQVKSACESGNPTEISLIRKKIDNFILSSPIDRFPI